LSQTDVGRQAAISRIDAIVVRGLQDVTEQTETTSSVSSVLPVSVEICAIRGLFVRNPD
jgi:hypothetical protein